MYVYDCVCRISLKICPLGSSEKPPKGMVLRVLQFFSVFCDWGRDNPLYLHSAQASSGGSSAEGTRRSAVDDVVAAMPDLLRVENRARSSMRVTLGDMISAVKKGFRHAAPPPPSPGSEEARSTPQDPPSKEAVSVSDTEKENLLSEHIELRGYLPLAAACEVRLTSYTYV